MIFRLPGTPTVPGCRVCVSWSRLSPVCALPQQHSVQTALHEALGHQLVLAEEGRHLGRHLPEGRVVPPDDAAAEDRSRLDVERHHLRDAAGGRRDQLLGSSELRRDKGAREGSHLHEP